MTGACLGPTPSPEALSLERNDTFRTPKGGENTYMAILKGRKTMANETKTLKVGDQAPEFTLRTHHGDSFSLADQKGKKNIVMAFYPFAFTAV